MITESGFHISVGNMKLGNIHNFSTTPIRTCAKGVPCGKKCYAMKSYRQYENVRNAWDENTKLLEEGKYQELIDDLTEHITRYKCKYFRFSVAGDIWTAEYWNAIWQIARLCPDCHIWIYTKQYDVLREWDAECEKTGNKKPINLAVILSEWHDYKPEGEWADKYGRALMDDGTEKMPECGYKCPSDCRPCKFCATMTTGDIVIFHAH